MRKLFRQVKEQPAWVWLVILAMALQTLAEILNLLAIIAGRHA